MSGLGVSGRAGVQTSLSVQGPMYNGSQSSIVDPNSGGTWALAWFVAALVILWLTL